MPVNVEHCARGLIVEAVPSNMAQISFVGEVVHYQISPMKRAQKELTIRERLKALKELDSGSSVRDVASKYGASVGAVQNWKKNRQAYEDMAKNNQNIDMKRTSRLDGNSADLDERVYNWFITARSRNIPISGPIIQAKAREVASAIGLNDFKASNGWLEAFRTRHCIVFRALSGESANVDLQTVEDWKLKMEMLLDGYESRDIWNLDETGLFWRLLPSASLDQKSKQSKGGKHAKERLTVCLLCSCLGEKFKPLVIGKSNMPRAFNKTLPSNVIWRANAKAWMTGALFFNYMESFNAFIKTQHRKVVLLLDNAPVHGEIDMECVKLVFLPATTTSVTQPLDAGIIKNFKVKYRSQLMMHVLSAVDNTELNGDEIVKSVTLKHATHWIPLAWNQVSESTIQNCFGHVGVGEPRHSTVNNVDEEEFYDMAETLGLEEVVAEENVAVFDEFSGDWESQILHPNNAIDDEEDNIEESDELPPRPTIKDVLESLRVLQNFALYEQLDEGEDAIYTLQKKLLKLRVESMRDSKITHFFKRIDQ